MRFDWSDIDSRAPALARPAARLEGERLAQVEAICERVRDGGWDALVAEALRLDRAAPQSLAVAPFAAAARSALSAAQARAIAQAADAIEAFHRATLPRDCEVETAPGVRVAKTWRPLERVGLYVPGGRAPLFSTLMMLAIPAQVAGVQERIVVTPPRADGGLDPAVALAAERCGIERIWTVGGAQAIAALAYGAGPIPKVDCLCGPGNFYVAAAKALVSSRPGGPGIDLPAGPSELLVIADAQADPDLVAADLLSQAEHDLDAQALLVSPDAGLLDAAEARFASRAAALGGPVAPLRSIRCADLDEAIAIANAYAPEHLSLQCADADARVAQVRHAGAVFVGASAAESFGDYLAGSSHVLPTDGTARFTGGVSTLTFLKAMTVQRLTREGAARLAAPAALLARLEGLEAHARAAEARAATLAVAR